MLNSKTCLVALSALLLSFGAIAQTANPESGNANHAPLGANQLSAATVASGMPSTESMPAGCCEKFVTGNALNSASFTTVPASSICPPNVPAESLTSECRFQLAKSSTTPTVNGGAINEGNKGK